MKDIDFDELDKAVHSLMGGVKPQVDDRDPQKTLAIAPTLSEDEKPAYEKVEEAAKKIGSETIALPDEGAFADRVIEVPVSKGRSGGRFMDVMHPSADMKLVSTPAPTPVKPAPVAPVAPEKKPSPVAEKPQTDEVNKPEVAVSEKPEPKEEVKPVEEPQVARPTSVVAAPGSALVEPLSTPFLADAKVEKRPLGGAPAEADEVKNEEAAELDAVTEGPSVPDESAPDAAAQLPSAPEKIVSVPDEYHDVLLAIESQDPLELDDAPEAVVPEVTSVASESAIPPSAEPADSATSLEESGAIYDVNDYHQPLNHPAKHPSGWLWVILTIILIAIGGGAAAAFYLLTT